MTSMGCTKGICPICAKEVIKTHRMQELGKQVADHIRTHGLTKLQAKQLSWKAQYS